MEKKYIIKNFDSQTYYCGEVYENDSVLFTSSWDIDSYIAYYFDTFEDAENFIKRESGRFQIEILYIN